MALRKFVAPRSSLAGSPERYIGKASAVRQAVAKPVQERAGRQNTFMIDAVASTMHSTPPPPARR